jgi:pilus assembly protein CpaE
MEPRKPRQPEVNAILIAPDRDLAAQFTATQTKARSYHLLAELKNYPPAQTLDIRLRQLRPDIVFVDLATDLAKASEIIEFVAAFRPQIFVVGLHKYNDTDAILASLRAGASEYLYAPFDVEMQKEAIGRIAKKRQPQARSDSERGRLVTFASTKPGSGASTLASQTAFCLQKTTNKRILLADFDLWNGTIGFFFKLSHWYSLADVLARMEQGEEPDWGSLVVNAEGVDVLPAPEQPKTISVEPERLHDLLDYTRQMYDWVVIDLPSVFEKLSLITLTASDDSFLVCTAELPSLHLTRKAVAYLNQLGVGQERYRVLVNRLGKQDTIAAEDMAKIFGAGVYRTFPNDYLSLHKGLTVGQPLGTKTPLGRNIDEFVAQLAGAGGQKRTSGFLN